MSVRASARRVASAFARLLAAALAVASAAHAEASPAPPSERLMHAGPPGRATLSDPASIESFLDGYVAAAMADQYPPGLMVAIATRSGVFVKAYGVANAKTGVRATPETLFRIASISKTFVWTSVMMLVDEGRLDLDADVNSYLETVRVRKKFGAPVTLNHLMAHRAGFEDTLGDFFQSKTGRTYEEALIATAPARVAPPGERTSYSNWGTDLAAQIVADVSGMPYDEFVRTRILKPLGMVSTVQHDPAPVAKTPLNEAALDARLSAPHGIEAGAPVVLVHDAIDPIHAAGGIALDARDAARWLQFFLNSGVVRGERLLSPQAFTTMRLRAFADRTGAPDLAHGFMETEIAGERTYGHGGTLTGFIADMTVAPSLGVGVFVAANGAESPRLPDLVSRAVIEHFAASPDQYSSPWPVVADEEMKRAAKSVAGIYRNARRVETRLEKIASLGADVRIAAKDDGSLVVTAAGREQRYYPFSKDLWTDRSRDRLFAYRNADGSVARLSWAMGTDSLEPVSFLQSADGFNAAIGLAAFFSLTAFLGAWRRQGREVATTREGRWLALGHALAAFLFLAFIGVIVWTTIDLAGKTLPDLQSSGWPPASLIAAIAAAHVAALVALLVAAGTIPVFARSGWSLWRKAHYVLFAGAMLFALFELWTWRLILSPASG